MKKVKVIFADGSILEIPENNLDKAIARGAKLYEESAEKKVSVKFADGSSLEVPERNKDKAIARGGIIEPSNTEVEKKKESSTGLDKPAMTAYLQGLKTPEEIESKKRDVAAAISQATPITQTAKPFKKQQSFLSPEEEAKQTASYKEAKDWQDAYDVHQGFIKKVNETAQTADYGVLDNDGAALKNIFENSYEGKQAAKSILEKNGIDVENIELKGNDPLFWKTAAKEINKKNQQTYIDKFGESVAKTDSFITSIQPGVYERTEQNLKGDIKESVKVDVPSIYADDSKSIGTAILAFQKILSDGATVYKGNDVKRILSALEFKLEQVKRKESIGDDIVSLDPKIGIAIDAIEASYGKVNDPSGYKVSDFKTSQHQAKLVQRGLEYYRDAKPNLFKNAMRTLEKGSQLDEGDYAELLWRGQKLENDNIRLSGNPELVGTETTFIPKLASRLKARQSALLGETLKNSPFRGEFEYSGKAIDWAIENTDWEKYGVQKPTKEAAEIIKLNENKWFYDEIPKSGVGHSLLEGVTEPLYAIARTFEDWTSDSYAEDYLRSKQLDRETGGSQMLMDDKGNLIKNLQSDQGNVWFEIVKGTGSFITQMALTRGIGSPFAATVKAGLSAVPGASLLPGVAAGVNRTASAVSNFMGTGISSYLQGFGDAYENTLQKTGDPVKAQIMGHIEGAIAFGTEQFLLETKVGSKIFKNLTGDVSENIYNIVRSGLDPAEKIKKVSSILKTFAKSSGDVFVQENFEEVSAVILSRIAQSIVTPNVPQDMSLLDELGETIHGTSLAMAVPAVASGVAASKNRFTKKAFIDASLNFKYTESVLKKQLLAGTATQDEYNKAISLLMTNQLNTVFAPKISEDGKEISKEKIKEYGFQQTVVQMNLEKAKKAKENNDEVQAKLYEAKAKEAQEVQGKIVKGQPVDTFTQSVDNPVTDDQWKEKIAAAETEEEKEKLMSEHGDWIKKQQEQKADDELLDQVRSKSDKLVAAEELPFFIEQTANDPAQAIEKYGEDAANTLLSKATDEQLARGAVYLAKFDPNNPAIDILQEEMDRREDNDATDQINKSQNILIGPHEYRGKDPIEAANHYVEMMESGKKPAAWIPAGDIQEKALEKAAEKNGWVTVYKEVEGFGSGVLFAVDDDAMKKLNDSLNSINKEGETAETSAKVGDALGYTKEEIQAWNDKMFKGETDKKLSQGGELVDKQITKEAEDLLASIGEGSKPAFITKNLEKIAKENGITITDEMTSDDVIDALKEKQSQSLKETTKAGSVGVGGDVKAKNKAFEELVNLIPTTDLRRPNGSIGTQGFSPENLVEVARHIAKEMGFDIPAYDKNKGTSEIKQVIDYLKNNKEAQQKIRDYVVKDPVVVSLLPDNTYEIEDGNHRANLLNLIGVDVIPTIELNGRDKQTAINEHNSKVEAVEQSLKETTKAGSGGVGVGVPKEVTISDGTTFSVLEEKTVDIKDIKIVGENYDVKRLLNNPDKLEGTVLPSAKQLYEKMKKGEFVEDAVPILISPSGNLLDGNNRIHAYLANGVDKVKVLVVKPKETTKAQTPSPKEGEQAQSSKVTEGGKGEKIAELEAERDMDILREKADIGELEFIAEENLPKEEVDVMRKGEVIGTKKVPNEKLRLQQKEISDKFDKLKDLLVCLTGKKGK